jgi:hypothetical protein
VLEKSDKCVGKRMRGRIVLDKKRIISNVWQLLGVGTPSPLPAAVAVAPPLPPPAKHLKLFFFCLTQFFPSFSF